MGKHPWRSQFPSEDLSPRRRVHLPEKDLSPHLPEKDLSPHLPEKDLSPRRRVHLPEKNLLPHLPEKDLLPRRHVHLPETDQCKMHMEIRDASFNRGCRTRAIGNNTKMDRKYLN